MAKTINARQIQKHDVEENWNKANHFIPKKGEIIVYDPDENYDYSRMKIGDGVSNVNALPFANKFDSTEIPMVQADWNQTDTTQADFIKNKPIVDSTYNATSKNAQSGKAVAEAVEQKTQVIIMTWEADD